MVFDLIIGKIEQEIAKDEDALAGLRQASIDAPGAMESHSDTNKFQSGSMANSVGFLIEEKYNAIATIRSLADEAAGSDRVGVGTIVEVEDLGSGKIAYYFVLPVAGGVEVALEEKEIVVIASTAPLAQVLLNKRVGDVAEFSIPNSAIQVRRLKILSIF